ncbi:hypothetical protein Trydic_g15095 [Trypoxylus dichotomus]
MTTTNITMERSMPPTTPTERVLRPHVSSSQVRATHAPNFESFGESRASLSRKLMGKEERMRLPSFPGSDLLRNAFAEIDSSWNGKDVNIYTMLRNDFRAKRLL